MCSMVTDTFMIGIAWYQKSGVRKYMKSFLRKCSLVENGFPDTFDVVLNSNNIEGKFASDKTLLRELTSLPKLGQIPLHELCQAWYVASSSVVNQVITSFRDPDCKIFGGPPRISMQIEFNSMNFVQHACQTYTYHGADTP